MRLVIVYKGENQEGIETLAKEFGADLTEVEPLDKISKIITIKEGPKLSFKASITEYNYVPLGFKNGFRINFKKKWGKNINLINTEKIEITIAPHDNIEIASWIIWYYLEALADREIGRLWF